MSISLGDELPWLRSQDRRRGVWPSHPRVRGVPVINAQLDRKGGAQRPRRATGSRQAVRCQALDSPRASAALLRLVIQKLCVHLGEPGENLNDDIGALVSKGLPVHIQQALDSVRVIGNNSVHPGEMSPEDTTEVARALFDIVNWVTEAMITRPAKIELTYKKLPTGAKDSVKRRDQGP